MMRVIKTLLLWLAFMLNEQGVFSSRSGTVRLCGRTLSDVMSRVCRIYNSPTWDVPKVVDGPGSMRRKRGVGIANECCIRGCTIEQLNEYCAVVGVSSDSRLDELESHLIADRSAEQNAAISASAASASTAQHATSISDFRRRHEPGHQHGRSTRGEVGRWRDAGAEPARGYGVRARARGRRCWCRRKRRAGRRRSTRMGGHRNCSARCTRRGHSIPTTNVGSHTSL